MGPLASNLGAPVGVFDSGVGGLSILAALRLELPGEDFVYFADSGHAPYGERDDAFVLGRTRIIAQHLQAQHHIKALVIACNTATAAAIHLLRQELPALPIVGVEPALKPAASASHTHRVGVMATRSTLASAKFNSLLRSQDKHTEFICQPCDGLAAAIEHADAGLAQKLCAQYTAALGRFGAQPGGIDTLVLGCTHYPFASHALQALVGSQVQLIDSGAPVARQTRRVLQAAKALTDKALGTLELYTSGDTGDLESAAQRWLGLECRAQTVSI